MQQFVVVSMPRGSVGLVAGRRGLSHVILMRHQPIDGRACLRRMFPDAQYCPGLLSGFQRQLERYFGGHRVTFRVLPDLSSLTPFQRDVLCCCAEIGYGDTITYGELAKRLGRPRAARAVGGALARNPVPLVVPCHRVVSGDGSPGGFSAEQGVSLKRWLLNLESGRRDLLG